MSQKSDILHHLLHIGPLTRLTSFTEYGCFELAARILEIERDGWIVEREPFVFVARNGTKKRLTKYTAAYKPGQMNLLDVA